MLPSSQCQLPGGNSAEPRPIADGR